MSTDPLADFEQLKRKVEQRKQQKEQSIGAYKNLMEQIKRDFNCSSLEEAEKLEQTRLKEEKQLEKRYVEARQVFDKKWQSFLENET